MRFLSPIRHPDIEVVRAAWRGYVDTRLDPRGIIRPYVFQAWERSRDAGCDPRMGRAEVLCAADTEALLERRKVLRAVAEPFLAALSRSAGGDRHAAMLADPDGRLLSVTGDEETLCDEGFPRPGALLAESHAGANGVGTALAEAGYVELVGPEHYIEGFHAFTCQGVPLHGPAGIAGVLSMSVRRLETADRVRDILFCASEAAACELLARWLSEATRLATAEVLESLRQDMVQRITLARLQLELAARQLASGLDAGETIRAAAALSRKFSRQAAVWRDLALQPARPSELESIELAALAEDFMELMQTEARVAGVTLVWGRVDPIRVVGERISLSREVLRCFLTAMQAAAAGEVLDVRVGKGAAGGLAIGRRSVDGEAGEVISLRAGF